VDVATIGDRIADLTVGWDDRAQDTALSFDWPLPNVWLGVSAEDFPAWDARVHLLKATPAAVRFVSYEPAVGPLGCVDLDGVDWLIAGGESGPDARPPHPEWFRDARDQCREAGVPFLFKQWGEWSPIMPENFCRLSKNTWSHRTFAWGKNGQQYNPVNPAPDDFPLLMYRVGKKKAGRLLDGALHHEFPVEAVLA
jgi:hypothetical protein